VSFTKYLLHVSAVTEPSSGRSLITFQNNLLIVGCDIVWVTERGMYYRWLFYKIIYNY